MKQQKIYLEFSDDILEFFSNNNLSLKTILNEELDKVEIEEDVFPNDSKDGIKTMALGLVVSDYVALGLTASAILLSINEILKTYLANKVVLYTEEVVLQNTETGELLKDKNGDFIKTKQKEATRKEVTSEMEIDILRGKFFTKSQIK